MTLHDALSDLLECRWDGIGELPDVLAPIIEKGLDAVIDKMVECYGFTGEMPKEIRDRWHARFVAAMVEGS